MGCPGDDHKIKEQKNTSPLGAPSAATLVLVLIGQALQPGRYFLFGLHQDVQQVLGDVAILIIEE